MLFSPQYVALLGGLTYLLIWWLSPLELVYPVSWSSLTFIAIGYLSFFAGCLLTPALLPEAPPRREPVRAGFNARAFWAFAVVGAAGMALRLYDKYQIRGLDIGLSALDSRELLMETGAGPVAVLAGVLYPFCYVPMFIYLARARGEKTRPGVKWLAMALFLMPSLDALMLLSRSTLLVALGMMFFSAACFVYGGRLLHPRLLRGLLIGLVLMGLVSSVVFASRLGEMNVDLIYSILNSVYGFTVRPSKEAMALLGENTLSASITQSLIPATQYYVHGIFEFGLLWDRPDGQVFTMGVQHFAPYVKALSIFGVVPPLNFGDNGLYFRYGVFSSFFGALWVDFGYLAPVFMVIFGALCKYSAREARAGRLGAMPMHTYLCVVIFFMPVVNFLISAQGMYVINAFIVSWYVLNRMSGQARARAGGRA